MNRVLIIEDESDIRELVAMNLSLAGLDVLEAKDGLEGLQTALREKPDLIVLDLMLPEMPGEEVLRKLRQDAKMREVPVIMLTAKSQTEDRTAGLEQGADDYLTKPFSPKELTLRVQGLLRRVTTAKPGSLEIDDFHLDYKRQRFRLSGEEIDLTVTEFRLLALLMEQKGTPIARPALLKEVWGYNDSVQTRTLDTHVKRLREKIAPHGERIVTERSIGYLFR